MRIYFHLGRTWWTSSRLPWRRSPSGPWRSRGAGACSTSPRTPAYARLIWACALPGKLQQNHNHKALLRWKTKRIVYGTYRYIFAVFRSGVSLKHSLTYVRVNQFRIGMQRKIRPFFGTGTGTVSRCDCRISGLIPDRYQLKPDIPQPSRYGTGSFLASASHQNTCHYFVYLTTGSKGNVFTIIY